MECVAKTTSVSLGGKGRPQPAGPGDPPPLTLRQNVVVVISKESGAHVRWLQCLLPVMMRVGILSNSLELSSGDEHARLMHNRISLFPPSKLEKIQNLEVLKGLGN